MSMIALNNRQADALIELARYERQGRMPYWWRKASMRQLADLGLVVRDAEHSTPKSPAWKITEIGKSEAEARAR